MHKPDEHCHWRIWRPGTTTALWLLLGIAALAPLGAQAAAPKWACAYNNPWCVFKSRTGFGATVLDNKVYYHGGQDASDPTRPIIDTVLEMVDLDTMMPYVLPLSPSNPKNSTRYNHLLATWRNKLVMLGGQVDDQNGQSSQVLDVLVMDPNDRTWVMKRRFQQQVAAEIVFRTGKVQGDILTFITNDMYKKDPGWSGSTVRSLNLSMSGGGQNTPGDLQGIDAPMSGNLRFLLYNLSSAIGSVFPRERPEDLLLLVEAKSSMIDLGCYDQKEPQPGDIVFSVLLDGKEFVPASVKLDKDSPLQRGKKGSTGNSLKVQLLNSREELTWKSGEELAWSMAMWTVTEATYSASPRGSATARKVSVLSLFTLKRVVDNPLISVVISPLHLFVASPPGYSLDHLQTLDMPMYREVQVTKAMRDNHLVVPMPYVGEVSHLGPEELRVMEITQSPKGFVVRGHAKAGPDCVQRSLGVSPFILSIELHGTTAAPTVRGGSWYTSCEALNTVDEAGELNAIVNNGQKMIAGTGIYRIDAKSGPVYMMWSPAVSDELGFFSEYYVGGTHHATLWDPFTRDISVKNITLPGAYGFPTHLATCLMTPSSNSGGTPLYVEYGGFLKVSKGTPSQPPTAAVSVMELAMDRNPWSMQAVAGRGLPARAAAAMACGPDGVAYVFGGLEDKGDTKASKYAPTNTLYRFQMSGAGTSYSFSAEQLKSSGISPPARSQHVLLYLPSGFFTRIGKEGALLLHGGSNLNDTEYMTDAIRAPGFSKWFEVFNDAWLYDIAANRWERLSAGGVQPGLTWHAATINQPRGLGGSAGQVVLFGGITYVNKTNSFDREHAIFLLDERDGGLDWRTVQLDLGPKDANKVKYSNAAVAVAPGKDLMLLRLGKNLSVTKAPRTIEVKESSLPGWGLESAKWMAGDQVKLSAASGTIKLTQPLLLSNGVDMVGVNLAGGAQKLLTLECVKSNSSAVSIMSGGVMLRNVHIRGCNGSAIEVLEGDYPTPAILRNVTLSKNNGEDGAAVRMDPGAKLMLEDCTLESNNAKHSVIQAGPGTELALWKSTIRSNNGSAVDFTGSNLNITNVGFIGNIAAMGAGVLLGDMKGRGEVAKAIIRSCSFVKNKATGPGGAAIYMGTKSSLYMSKCLFEHNKADEGEGGALLGKDGSCLEGARDVNFTDNYAATTGGAVSLQAPVCVDVDTITLIRVSFSGNVAGGDGGGLYLSKMSSTNLTTTDLMFQNNTAEGRSAARGEGGGMYLGIWSASATFTRPTFLKNRARSSGGGLHALAVLSTVNMTNATAVGNKAQPTTPNNSSNWQDVRVAGGVVYMQGSQSVLIIMRGVFSGNVASQGGAVAQLADSNSTLVILGPANFSGNLAKNMGGAVSAGEGVNVTIIGGTFVKNIAKAGNAAGGGFYCQRCGHVTLVGSDFSSNTATFGGGAALLQPQTRSGVTDTKFLHNIAVPADLNTSAIEQLYQEATLEAQDALGRDAALFAELRGVDNTTFDSGAYAGGGGLYVSVIDQFDVNGTTVFMNNTGKNGGGFLARTDLCRSDSSSCLLHLPATLQLSNNTALRGAGGGVLITNLARVNGTIFGCSAGAADAAECLQNQARRRHLLQGVAGTPATPHVQNSASGGYGNDIATAATTMTLVQYGGNTACSRVVLDQPQSVGEVSIAPGQPLRRAFFLRDALGHCVTGGISDANMGLQAVLLDEDEKQVDVVLIGNITNAVNGTGNFSSLEVHAKNGQYVLEFKPYPFSTVLEPARLRLNVRNCSAGEVTRRGGGNKYTCQECTVGTYSFAPENVSDPTSDMNCISCGPDDHAYCNGAAKVPFHGWWQSHPRSDQIHACLTPAACIHQCIGPMGTIPCNNSQPNLTDYLNLANYLNSHKDKTVKQLDTPPTTGVSGIYTQALCSPGYEGPLCGACSVLPALYGRQGFKCVKCTELYSTVLVYIALCAYMFVLVIVAGVMQSKQVQRRHASIARSLQRQARRLHETMPGEPEEPMAGYVGWGDYYHDGPPMERIPETEPDVVHSSRIRPTAGSLPPPAAAVDHASDQQWFPTTAQRMPPQPAAAASGAAEDSDDPARSGYQPLSTSDLPTAGPPTHGKDFVYASDDYDSAGYSRDQDIASFGHASVGGHVPPSSSFPPVRTAQLAPSSSSSVDSALGGDNPFFSSRPSKDARQIKLPTAARTTAVVPQHALKKSPAVGPLRSGPSPSSSSMAGAQPGDVDPFEVVPSLIQRRGPGVPNAAGAMLVPVDSGDKRQQSLWERLFNVESLDDSDRFSILESQLSTVASECQLLDSVVRAMVANNGKGSLIYPLRVDKYYVSDIIKLLMSHLQMLGIMRLMGLSWPTTVENILTYTDQSLPVIGWISMECMMSEAEPPRRSIKKTLLQLLTVFVAMLAMCAFWFIFWMYNQYGRRRLLPWFRYYRPRIIMSTVLILFYLYPAVSNILVSLFAHKNLSMPSAPGLTVKPPPNSYAVELHTKPYWTQDTLQPFFEGAHMALVVVFGIPGILLYSVGFPVVMALVLRLNKNNLWVDHKVEMQYGFLYDSYHIKFYYWESVFLLEKFALVVCVTMLATSSQPLQVLVAMAIITLAAVLQITFQPFCCKMLDTLQRASFHTLQITLFLLMIASLSEVGGVLEADRSADDALRVKIAVMVLIGLFNVLLVVLFLVCFYLECKRLLLMTLAKKDNKVTCRDLYVYVRNSLLSCGKPGGVKSASTFGFEAAGSLSGLLDPYQPHPGEQQHQAVRSSLPQGSAGSRAEKEQLEMAKHALDGKV